MLRFLLYFFFLMVPFLSQAKQKKFFVSVDKSLLQEDGLHVNSYGLSINGQKIKADTHYIRYTSHYPAFDTIYYTMNDAGNPYKIITRFVPGKRYVITLGCCAMFEFMEKNKLEKLYELYRQAGNNYDKMDSIRLRYHESAALWVTGKNLPATDSVYAYYGDHTGMPYAYLLNSQKTGPMRSYYGYYSSNGAAIMFYKFPKGAVKPAEFKNGYIEDLFPEIEYELASVFCRFFHNEKIMATYDARDNTIELKIIR